jgi:hypothetical protein
MSRAGVALIEAVMALAILSSAVVSTLGVLTAMAQTAVRLEERERELARAERVLTASSLLTRQELEQRLGVRRVGGFYVWLDRPEPDLFRIGVAPTLLPARELLATLVYRARPVVADGT